MAEKQSLSSKAILSPEARRDIYEILKWTEREFSREAAARYGALLAQALRDLQADYERPGSKPREDLAPGIRTYHLRFSRDRARGDLGVVGKPRHFVIYRRKGASLEIVRILHDTRDLQRHMPDAE